MLRCPERGSATLAALWSDPEHGGGGTGSAITEWDFEVQRGEGCRADGAQNPSVLGWRCVWHGKNPRERAWLSRWGWKKKRG